jgi:acetoacetyl-CoA synthetase
MSTNPIWSPSTERAAQTNMYRFMQLVNEKFSTELTDYEQLHKWSVDNIEDFWRLMWDEAGIIASKGFDQVVDDVNKMPGANWFTGAKLNFAENLLRFRDDREALVFRGEAMSEPEVFTYAELYDEVARMARALRDLGVVAGDRVVGYMPNMSQTIIAMLAATSIGAIWSSCSPDFGIKGVLDRFGQIEPKVIFAANGYSYSGKSFDITDKVVKILEQMTVKPKVVVIPYTEENPKIDHIDNAILYGDFLSKESGLEIEFEQLPFDHPLYIMYSSGTTGLPKCMVQSTGGILIHHIKELMLHTDVTRDDKLFYFTTCGWMMWNWMVSTLSLGATLVLFDGSPFYPDAGVLFDLAEIAGVTIFGTSAKYISAVEDSGLKPKEKYDLSKLKGLLSTGSPLAPESYDFVYNQISPDVCLSSISGGTDINGCFAAGNPMGPVYRGELQCRTLAMNVHAYSEAGQPVINEKGELVCTSPFPSMPIYFWNDEKGEKYHDAYFGSYPGIWTHGDFIEVNDHGGVVIYGRSDATLNPQGVRIGTAEIYRVVEAFEEIDDSVAVGQEWDNDVRVVLFVKLPEGRQLTDELIKKVKTAIRTGCSPRHVPAKVIAIADIPYTINMKKVELAVKKIIHNQEVTNRDALANPESLELYRDLEDLKS